MDYTNTVFTRTLNVPEFKTEFDSIIKTLEQNHIDNVEILFGWAWGNDYKNWIPFQIKVSDIVSEIDKPQKQSLGQFRHDDIFITLTEWEIEFLFCHESDIHLSFNDANEITASIIDTWNSKEIIHSKRTNNVG